MVLRVWVFLCVLGVGALGVGPGGVGPALLWSQDFDALPLEESVEEETAEELLEKELDDLDADLAPADALPLEDEEADLAPSDPAPLEDEVEEILESDVEPEPVEDLGTQVDENPVVEPVLDVGSAEVSVVDTQMLQPNLAYESYLYRIFRNYHSQVLTPAEWSRLVEKRGEEKYTVQAGDTLWDISRTFFGDGHYWPKMWAINRDIFNPHLIVPGRVLSFLMGSESEPPSLVTVEKVATDSETTALAENQDAAPAGSIKASSGDWVENFKSIPPSLYVSSVPMAPPTNTQHVINVSDIKVERSIPDSVHVAYYASAGLSGVRGAISEIEHQSRWAYPYQYLYLNLFKRANVGDKLLVVRDMGPNHAGNPKVTNPRGRTIQVQGEIKITQRLKYNLYRAQVQNVLHPITLDAVVVRGSLEKRRIRADGPRKKLRARIVGGKIGKKRNLMGKGDIVYINRGSRSGAKEGDILSVRANRLIRYKRTALKKSIYSIGRLQVLKTTPRYTTAIVLHNTHPIYSGDYID